MSTFRRAAVLALTLLVVACGHMNVQVDVLNPDHVDAPEGTNAALWVAVAQSPETVENSLELVKKVHSQGLRSIAEEYRRAANRIIERDADGELSRNDQIRVNTLRDAADSLEADVLLQGALSQHYGDFRSDLNALNEGIRAALNAFDPTTAEAILAGDKPLPTNVSALLGKRQKRIKSFIDDLRGQVDDAAGEVRTLLTGQDALEKRVSTRAAQTKQELQRRERALFGAQGRSLATDVNAYTVASADDELWAPSYNKAKAAGQLGSVNIAIKLQRTGDFTIKGLTFDPSTVAQVASKVSAQSLVLATQIAGAPIAPDSPSGNAAALASGSQRVAEAGRRSAEIAASERHFNAALLDIAAAIVHERQQIEAGEIERHKAIKRIREMFDKHESRLEIPDPGNGD